MAYDISEELDIIENETIGETVRDAIVRAFRKVETSGLGVMLTTEEWDDLTDEEKNNGTMYFVSDMNVIDAKDYYFSGGLSDDKILVDHDILSEIASLIKNALNITGNISASEMPGLLNMIIGGRSYTGCTILKPIQRYKGPIYLHTSNGRTVLDSGYSDYMIDVYAVTADTWYLIGLGPVQGTRFRTAFFTTNPIANGDTVAQGTFIYAHGNNPPLWTNTAYKPSADGYILVYYDSTGNETAGTFLLVLDDIT